MAATAQINVRIDAACKASGDAGLSAAGLSPSQAIRALWELAARNVNSPDAIIASLFPESQKQRKTAANAQREERAQLIANGPRIVRNAGNAGEIPDTPFTASLSFDELKEAAAMEQYGSVMGWDAHE